MHEGHHGILDGIEEEHHHEDKHEHKHDDCGSCHSCSGDKVSHEQSGSTKNLKKSLGVIALSALLIVVFRLIFN